MSTTATSGSKAEVDSSVNVGDVFRGNDSRQKIHGEYFRKEVIRSEPSLWENIVDQIDDDNDKESDSFENIVDDETPEGWEEAVKNLEKKWGMPLNELERLERNNARYIEPPIAGKEDGIMNTIVLGVVGSLGQLLIRGLNRVHFYGLEKLYNWIEYRPKNQALLTVSNHRSVLDDPFFLGGILPKRILWNASKMRWGLCGVDICFKSKLFNRFLTLGRTLPLIRKGGLDQKPLYTAAEKLIQGEWIHMYPEGRVHQQGIGYFKRGIGKMISIQYEAGRGLPTILPMYHEGMEYVMPQNRCTNKIESKIPRTGQDVYLMVGDPMPIDDIFDRLAPACHEAGGSAVDPPECLRLYEEIADRLAHTLRLLRAKLRKRVKREHGKILGDPYEIS